VDEIMVVEPARCRHCEQPFAITEARCHGRVWRHQVIELLPLAVRVTEYQMGARRCLACGKPTRADLLRFSGLVQANPDLERSRWDGRGSPAPRAPGDPARVRM
jgi:hypothetical protein